jgi:hypothetical protein
MNTMTKEQFDALIAKLEDEARRNPVGYQLNVSLLALLGYAYLGVVCWRGPTLGT